MQTLVDLFSDILQSDIDHAIYSLTDIRSTFIPGYFCGFSLTFIVNLIIFN